MTGESRITLRANIVQILNAQNETSLLDLLRRLHELGVEDDTSVKAVIWELVADGDVDLTSRRALRIPQKYRRELVLAR